jgi:uncharacterized protein
MSQANTIRIANELLARLGSGASPASVASLFSHDVEWVIAGDDDVLPWIGNKKGRKAVEDFVRDTGHMLTRLRFEVTEVFGGDERAVIIGELASQLNSNKKVIETSYALILTIADDQITRFQMLEDSFAVSRAVH